MNYSSYTSYITMLPASEPLTLEEVRNFLKIDTNEEDKLLIDLIRAAREVGERYTEHSFMTQEWQMGWEKYFPQTIILPRGPVQDIVFIKCVSSYQEKERKIDPSLWHLHEDKKTLTFHACFLCEKGIIRYRTGWGSHPGAIPSHLRHAMLLHISCMYEQRISSFSVPISVIDMYKNYRDIRI